MDRAGERAHESETAGRERRRIAPAIAISVLLHAVAVAGVLTPAGPRTDDAVVVDLVTLGEPSAQPAGAAGDAPGATPRTLADAPALGAAPPELPPAAEREQVVAEREALTAELDALVAERQDLVAERDELAARHDEAVAERDALVARLDAETTARARLGDRIAALAAEKVAIASELETERARAARVEQELADQRAAEEARIRDLQRTYDDLFAALRDQIADQEVALRGTRDGLTVSIVDRVLFPSGQAMLTADGRAVIDEVARVLAATPTARIVIEGHTDDVPIGPELRARFPSNWELSTARASEVVRRLVERGLPPQRLEAIGRADTRPVASNDTEAGRRRNRRIEIVLSGPTTPVDGPQPAIPRDSS